MLCFFLFNIFENNIFNYSSNDKDEENIDNSIDDRFCCNFFVWFIFVDISCKILKEDVCIGIY